MSRYVTPVTSCFKQGHASDITLQIETHEWHDIALLTSYFKYEWIIAHKYTSSITLHTETWVTVRYTSHITSHTETHKWHDITSVTSCRVFVCTYNCRRQLNGLATPFHLPELCVAVRYSVLQCVAVWCSWLQCVAVEWPRDSDSCFWVVCCSVLQYVAVYCGVLVCCCSVLQ